VLWVLLMRVTSRESVGKVAGPWQEAGKWSWWEAGHIPCGDVFITLLVMLMLHPIRACWQLLGRGEWYGSFIVSAHLLSLLTYPMFICITIA